MTTEERARAAELAGAEELAGELRLARLREIHDARRAAQRRAFMLARAHRLAGATGEEVHVHDNGRETWLASSSDSRELWKDREPFAIVRPLELLGEAG